MKIKFAERRQPLPERRLCLRQGPLQQWPADGPTLH